MKRVIVFLLMILLVFTASSCMSTGSDELSIKHINNPDGSIEVIFFDSYGDEIYRLLIPAGEQGIKGEDGTGISSIRQELSEDGTKTNITIEFTDPEMGNVEFSVANGISVVASQRIDKEDGTSALVFEFSDGSFSNEIELPEGPAGNGIDDFKYVLNEDKSVSILISFTNEELFPDVIMDIPAPQNGKDGNGIEWIEANTEGEFYVIKVKLTQNEEELKFDLPKPKDPNRWLNGYGSPLTTDGEIGDFYFDKLYDAIWYKDENLGWHTIVDFGSTEIFYKVTFNLNDTDVDDNGEYISRADLGGMPNQYNVKSGNYFKSNGNPDIPEPTRAGYKFLGWYTTAYPKVNNVAFNDLTPVVSDLELFAVWEKIN